MPLNMNRASGPRMPFVACVSRSTTPFLSAIAPEGELAWMTMSGSSTLRIWSMLHPKSVSANAQVDSARTRKTGRVIGRSPPRSEGDVETGGPVGRRRHRLEVAHDPGGALEVVRLGVDARPARALPEIAAGHREAHATRPERPCPVIGQLVGDGRLTQADEARLFDEAVLRTRWRFSERHHPRLLPQRRRAIDQPPAVVPVLAADPLGTVQLVQAALVVEQRVDPHPLVEQVDAARVGDLPARVGIADELSAVGHRDLVRR